MAGARSPAPWPRLRHTWWVFGLALGALGLFASGFLVQLRCGRGQCVGSPVGRLLDLDAIGGLPRLFTTALLAAVGVLAWRARRRVPGPAALWWTAVAGAGALLALAKLVSLHSVVKSGAPVTLTPLVGLLLAGLVLGALAVAGRRWGVAATRPVVLALAVYAGTALGLDLLTGLAAAVQDRVGPLTIAAATFAEELGEALATLLLLVIVRWKAPLGPAGSV